MARPRGLRCSRAGFNVVLRSRRLSLTEASHQWQIPLTTLSSFANGDNGVSMATVRKVEEAIGEEDAQAIFPQLLGFREPSERDVA